MKRENIITILFPTVIMTIITIVSFLNMDIYNKIDFKGIFIISLILIFPILFLLQGIKCAKNKTNVFLAFGVSILNFIILMLVYLNNSALIYILIYLVFGAIGYVITNFIIRCKLYK